MWKDFRRRLRYGLQYVPFTLNTLVCIVAAWLIHYVLYKPVPKPGSDDMAPNFQPFILLMSRMAFWFLIALIILSLLTTVGAWLYYVYLKSERGSLLQLDFTNEVRTGKKPRLYLQAALPGAFRPLLGFVKGRLFYDDGQLTDTFSLLSNKRKEQSLWRAAITGKSRLLLPDIREYQLRGAFIFFQDMLHLLSLPVRQNTGGQFFQPPVLTSGPDDEVAPKKTETLDVRIDQMRRVEGELLHYKSFEAGDDVRRIVWKVYARSRELVVRQPEMFEPYASHLYFYASFRAAVKTQWLGEDYLKEMLNYYKNSVWTVYDTLSRKEWEMRYIPDQQFTVPEALDAAGRASRIISNSAWHTDGSLPGYFNTRQGTVLCISSLTDPHELQQILDASDSSTVIYFIKLSRTFRHIIALGWLQRAIFLPPKDRLNRLRGRWVFSPMRLQIQRREKELQGLLDKSSVVTAVL